MDPFQERLEALQAEEQSGQEPETEQVEASPQERDIVTLLTLGKMEETFSLFSHEFRIKTLNMEEELKIEQLLTDQFSSVYNDKGYRVSLVAASLVLLDQEPLATALSPTDDTFLRSYNKVKKWYRPVIDAIYERCLALQERQNQALEEAKKA